MEPAVASDTSGLQDALRLSATILRIHQDHTYPGATVAGLSTPWGDTANTPGGYHLVWARDAVESGFALGLCGHVDSWSQGCSPRAGTLADLGGSAHIAS
jgi:glucoamylase